MDSEDRIYRKYGRLSVIDLAERLEAAEAALREAPVIAASHSLATADWIRNHADAIALAKAGQ